MKSPFWRVELNLRHRLLDYRAFMGGLGFLLDENDAI
jgi:hypothetical protein